MNPDMKWAILYCEASNELREASKKYWLACYRAALDSDDETLIQQAEHKLAQIALMDAEILQEA